MRILGNTIPGYMPTANGFIVEEYGIRFEHLGDETTKCIDELRQQIGLMQTRRSESKMTSYNPIKTNDSFVENYLNSPNKNLEYMSSDIHRLDDSNLLGKKIGKSKMLDLENITLHETLHKTINRQRTIGKKGNATITTKDGALVQCVYDFNGNELKFQPTDKDDITEVMSTLEDATRKALQLPLQDAYRMRFLSTTPFFKF